MKISWTVSHYIDQEHIALNTSLTFHQLFSLPQKKYTVLALIGSRKAEEMANIDIQDLFSWKISTQTYLHFKVYHLCYVCSDT